MKLLADTDHFGGQCLYVEFGQVKSLKYCFTVL